MTEAQMRQMLDRAIAKAETPAAFARQAGINRSLICHIRSGRSRLVPPKVLRAIGLTRVVSYQKIAAKRPRPIGG